MNFSRTHLLVALLAAALLGNVAWYLAAGWGKVTIHARQRPLREVAASIERQGGIRLRTTLDPLTPVTLNFDRVSPAEAVDRLAIVVDGRWRVAYLVGPRKREFGALLESWSAGNADPAWRWIDRPLPLAALAPGDDGEEAADPRTGAIAFDAAPLPAPPPAAAPDDGGSAAPAPATADAPPLAELQPLLEKAALLADVTVAVPTDWNPPVGSFSAHAAAPALFAKLARAGHGASEEVFLISVRARRGPRPETADGDAPPPIQNRMSPAAIDLALQGYVDRLPPARRSAAQAQLDARRAEWKEMQGLTPEQRRARWMQRLNDPSLQEQMQDRALDREAKMTPEQRDSRMSRYVASKAAAMGK